jgi:hypothetical protein
MSESLFRFERKIIMRRLLFCLSLSSLLVLSVAASAKDADVVGTSNSLPAEMSAPQRQIPPSVFGYPGKTCPGGSELYKGPEQKLAAESGAVYCRFARKVVVFAKKDRDKCPFGLKPYSGADAKPDPDVIWCEHDPSQKLAIPPLPSQPEKSK